jgi:WD40 repeat protein
MYVQTYVYINTLTHIQVISVSWHPDGRFLATGDSSSKVRIYSLASLSCTHTVGVGVDMGDGGKLGMVWCVTVLQDMTVFAGDCKGRTHVIDGRAGVVIRDFGAHHGGDILAMAADENEVCMCVLGC